MSQHASHPFRHPQLSPDFPGLKVLFITNHGSEADFARAFSAESQGRAVLLAVDGREAGMRVLREAAFDAVMVYHAPPRSDALATVEGLLTGGVCSPILVLGAAPAEEMLIPCLEAGADDYACADITSVRNLLAMIDRAVRQYKYRQSYEKLKQEKQHRVRREQDQAMQNLREERRLITELAGEQQCTAYIPPEVRNRYVQLLQTFVMMGSGSLSDEIRTFCRLLRAGGISAAQLAMMHSHVMEEMVENLGAKSCRHIIHRGELLRLTVLLELGMRNEE